MSTPAWPQIAGGRRLWLEFLLIYVLAPVWMALAVGTGWAPVLSVPLVFLGVLLLAIGLLSLTPGFAWRSLLQGSLLPRRRAAAVFLVGTAMAALLLTWWLAPQALFHLPVQSPGIWLLITLFYPVVSVLPQGIIYRALFFERYGGLFSSRRQAMAVNAGVFGLAHLFYLNWVALLLSIIGGWVFAWAYVEQRSFAFAMLLHAVAGWLLFSIGLGAVYFFHGAVILN